MDLLFAIGSGCSATMSLAWRDQCGGGKFLGETLLASGAFPKLGGYLSEGPRNQGSILEPILGPLFWETTILGTSNFQCVAAAMGGRAAAEVQQAPFPQSGPRAAYCGWRSMFQVSR